MAHGKSAAEIDTTAACMRFSRAVKTAQKLATADRKNEQATSVLDAARTEAVRAMAAAIPSLTSAQREQLRPLLSGSLPADQAGADDTAA